MRHLPILLAAALITVPLYAQTDPQEKPPWMPDLWAPETPVAEEPLPPPLAEDRPLALEENVHDELAAELAGLERSLGELALEETGETATPPPGAVPTAEELERTAYEELAATGHAPILARPTGAVFPFGETVPTLTCLPNRACDLELEAGEVVDGLALGDSARWQATQFFEGEETLKPHVLLKPGEAGLKTNLVLVTSRRTYHLELQSVSEEELENEGPAVYHHHVAFWYPESWARRLRTDEQLRAERAAREAEAQAVREAERKALTPVAQPFGAGSLWFGYEVELPRHRERRLPWQPVTVFDDGRRTFIVLPPVARAAPLPAVTGVLPDGGRFPVEVSLHGDWLVLPTLVEHLELVHGTGKERRFLTIRRHVPAGAEGGRS
jgi:type IV secretion system protein VirB9